MDFNTITIENERTVKAKFREFGVGVNMSNYSSENGSRWEDLINEKFFSIRDIRNRMLTVASKINMACNDELLGDNTVAFQHVTERDEIVQFTWLDIYTFLRAAYRYRIETVDYKQKKNRAAELKKFIDNNKSLDDKLKDAENELKNLQGDL